jgi:hypothetical protein
MPACGWNALINASDTLLLNSPAGPGAAWRRFLRRRQQSWSIAGSLLADVAREVIEAATLCATAGATSRCESSSSGAGATGRAAMGLLKQVWQAWRGHF